MGFRPKVRGVAMNPVDHPHGGGEGKSKGRLSVSKWGKPTKGFRTRGKHHKLNKWRVQRRPPNKKRYANISPPKRTVDDKKQSQTKGKSKTQTKGKSSKKKK